MFDQALEWILTNFVLVMLLLAVLFIIFHKSIRRNLHESEIIYRWVAFFCLGLTGIYAFVLHAFFPNLAASSIGWSTSPFQYEVAMADLAIGLLGILSFNASYGFRLATVVGATCWLWGDAFIHICQMIKYQNYTVGNAGSWFWMDVFVPLILILCIVKLPKVRR